jgi:hypothetical protein
MIKRKAIGEGALKAIRERRGPFDFGAETLVERTQEIACLAKETRTTVYGGSLTLTDNPDFQIALGQSLIVLARLKALLAIHDK